MTKSSGKKHPPQKKAGKGQSRNRALMLTIIVGGITVLLLAVAIGVSVYNRASTQPVIIKDAAEVASLLEGVPQQNNVLGQANAPVTMYMYEDLKCPTCQKFTLNVLPQIINDYVRTGKLRIVFQLQTFVGRQTTPGDSERGARFALAAGKQNRLWNFTDLFYHNQPAESQRYFTDEFLTSLGNEVAGLDVQKAFSETDSDVVTQELDEQLKSFKSGGFDGVPAFQIGKTGGAVTEIPLTLDYSVFRRSIDNLL